MNETKKSSPLFCELIEAMQKEVSRTRNSTININEKLRQLAVPSDTLLEDHAKRPEEENPNFYQQISILIDRMRDNNNALEFSERHLNQIV